MSRAQKPAQTQGLQYIVYDIEYMICGIYYIAKNMSKRRTVEIQVVRGLLQLLEGVLGLQKEPEEVPRRLPKDS